MVQLTKDEIIKITMRLQSVRQGLVQKAPFYAILLFGLRFSLDDMVERVYTDGERVAFNPYFLKEISDKELQFILLHTVSHVALGHPFRCLKGYDIELFDEACDIVVNSNIYQYMGKDESFITIKGLGVMPHKTYDGQEGYKFTVEQVYEQLLKIKGKKKDENEETSYFDQGDDTDNLDDEDGDGQEEVSKDDKNEDASNQAGDGEDKEDKDGQDEDGQGGKEDKDGQDKDGQGGKEDKDGKDKNGKEGKDLQGKMKSAQAKLQKKMEKSNKQILLSADIRIGFDDHSFWKGEDDRNIQQQTWKQRVIDASQVVMQNHTISIKQRSKSFGGCPMFAQRILEETTEGKLDWKTLLNNFVQEEICDYSFSPPDRRFSDSDFFLPDFNEKEEKVKNVWFVVDTSGSISDSMIMDAYNEIVSAIEIFGGSIESYLSFTESFITKPVPFSSVEDVLAIKPKGGGGNNFSLIFKYLETGQGLNLKDENNVVISVDEIIEPCCIVIITDGYDTYPEESMAKGIPVLWLINNNDASAEPPWGMSARIPQKKKEK